MLTPVRKRINQENVFQLVDSRQRMTAARRAANAHLPFWYFWPKRNTTSSNVYFYMFIEIDSKKFNSKNKLHKNHLWAKIRSQNRSDEVLHNFFFRLIVWVNTFILRCYFRCIVWTLNANVTNRGLIWRRLDDVADSFTLVIATGQHPPTGRSTRVSLRFGTLDVDALVLSETGYLYLGSAGGTWLLHLFEVHTLVHQKILNSSKFLEISVAFKYPFRFHCFELF